MSYGKLTLNKVGNYLDFKSTLLDAGRTVAQKQPVTFESLDQPFGFVSYSTTLQLAGDLLDGSNIRDFGYVYVAGRFVVSGARV